MGLKNPKKPSASSSLVGFSTKFSVLSSSIDVTELFSDIISRFLFTFGAVRVSDALEVEEMKMKISLKMVIK